MEMLILKIEKRVGMVVVPVVGDGLVLKNGL